MPSRGRWARPSQCQSLARPIAWRSWSPQHPVGWSAPSEGRSRGGSGSTVRILAWGSEGYTPIALHRPNAVGVDDGAAGGSGAVGALSWVGSAGGGGLGAGGGAVVDGGGAGARAAAAGASAGRRRHLMPGEAGAVGGKGRGRRRVGWLWGARRIAAGRAWGRGLCAASIRGCGWLGGFVQGGTGMGVMRWASRVGRSAGCLGKDVNLEPRHRRGPRVFSHLAGSSGDWPAPGIDGAVESVRRTARPRPRRTGGV